MPPGERAERFQFLRLQRASLELDAGSLRMLLLGDVAQERHDARRTVELDRLAADQQAEHAPVACLALDLQLAKEFLSPEQVDHSRAIGRVDPQREVEGAPPHGLGSGMAEGLLERVVHLDHDRVGAARDKDRWGWRAKLITVQL